MYSKIPLDINTKELTGKITVTKGSPLTIEFSLNNPNSKDIYVFGSNFSDLFDNFLIANEKNLKSKFNPLEKVRPVPKSDPLAWEKIPASGEKKTVVNLGLNYSNVPSNGEIKIAFKMKSLVFVEEVKDEVKLSQFKRVSVNCKIVKKIV